MQKRIYQSLGGTRSYEEKVWEAFGDQVGWRVGGSWLYYDELKFNQTAPAGHLPLFLAVDWVVSLDDLFGELELVSSSFALRLVDCNI